jgi:hypothetical protein
VKYLVTQELAAAVADTNSVTKKVSNSVAYCK